MNAGTCLANKFNPPRRFGGSSEARSGGNGESIGGGGVLEVRGGRGERSRSAGRWEIVMFRCWVIFGQDGSLKAKTRDNFDALNDFFVYLR